VRRAAAPLPPEEVWLGESWEEPTTAHVRSSASQPPESTSASHWQPRSSQRQQPTSAPRHRSSSAPPRASAPAARPPAPTGERRTVTIRGRGTERDLAWTAGQTRRRPSRPVHERPGFRPDRAAMWAVLLGLLLVLVAATSSHAAMCAPHAAAARTRDGTAPAARAMVIRAVPAVRAPAVPRHRA
jgi:hypothetical protein